MIIICPSCKKKFRVDGNLISDKGRNIQCGACNYVWFYKKSIEILEVKDQLENYDVSKNEDISNNELIEEKKIDLTNKIVNKSQKKDKALVKYQKRSQFTLNKFLSLIIVIIITFIGLVLILDTFKLQLYNIFPRLEFLLFNLFETMKDINLFIKDLI